MGQAFGIATVAWSACFTVTIFISLVTRRKTDAEMRGLVYSLTDIKSAQPKKWYLRPSALALAALVLVTLLNIWMR
jgi:SSS family solute:Na+ symporter